jgi:hypothetical protein
MIKVFIVWGNESVEKVSFLKSVPSAGSKIRNDHFLWLKLLRSLMQWSYFYDPVPILC